MNNVLLLEIIVFILSLITNTYKNKIIKEILLWGILIFLIFALLFGLHKLNI